MRRFVYCVRVDSTSCYSYYYILAIIDIYINYIHEGADLLCVSVMERGDRVEMRRMKEIREWFPELRNQY